MYNFRDDIHTRKGVIYVYSFTYFKTKKILKSSWRQLIEQKIEFLLR